MNHRGGIWLAACTAAVIGALCVPQLAVAWQASVASDGTLFFQSGPGEQNRVTISAAAGVFRITDPGGTRSASTGCSDDPIDPSTVNCTASVTLLWVQLGDGDDVATIEAPTPAQVFGNVGNDQIAGGPASDPHLEGGLGADTIDGGGGNDEIYGFEVGAAAGDSPNTLRGGDGADRVEGGDSGDVLVDGGPGDDPLVNGAGGDDRQVLGGDGNDTLSGGDGDDALDGGAGNDSVGRSERFGAAAVPAERGADSLAGGPGNDVLRPGTGGLPDADAVAGGPGIDTASYENAEQAQGVSASLDGLANDGKAGEGDRLALDIEALVGGAGDDTLRGGPGGETLEGRKGDDNLIGGGGDDVLRGGGTAPDTADGEDFLDGGPGQDTFDGGSEGDTLDVRDRETDGSAAARVSCGAGRSDFAIADRRDRLARDCDRRDTNPRDRPVLGSRVALSGGSDGFGFQVSGTRRFVPLEEHVNAPSGSTVDATNGSVRVVSAKGGARASARTRSSRAQRQAGRFSRGQFTVTQGRARGGLTVLTLKGGDFDSCGGSVAAASHGATTARRKRTPIRKLLANAKGRFQTKGRYSSTTVRGTIWTTEDLCDGTRTRVRQGSVLVLDRRGRRHIVRAGRSFFARR